MFIQTEATPNPATLKFIPGKAVLPSGTADFRTPTEAEDNSPLAARLFDIDGVKGVFLGSDFISVTKGSTEWQHLKPMILGAIMEHYMSGAPILKSDGANDGAGGNYAPEDEETVNTSRSCWRRACARQWPRTAATSPSPVSETVLSISTCAAPARAAPVQRRRCATALRIS